MNCPYPRIPRELWRDRFLKIKRAGSGKWATTGTESARVLGLCFAIALGAIATKSRRNASVYPTNLLVLILFMIGLAQNTLTGDNGLLILYSSSTKRFEPHKN